MKLNLDKRWIFASAVLLVIIIVITLIQNKDTSNEATSNETTSENSTESTILQETTEGVSNALEYNYFYIRPESQKRVIAIRTLEASELPVPYDFTSYGKQNYEDRAFYALVILEFEKDEKMVSEETQLEIISELKTFNIEQVYRQLEIRYEDDYAIFQHDYQFFVTSLTEPRLFNSYVLNDLNYLSESTPEATTIGVYRDSNFTVMFSLVDKRFISESTTDGEKEDYDWEGKTVIHKPSLTTVQGPSFSKITEEPRLTALTLGASSAVTFDRLGMPQNMGWLTGNYLAYEDVLIFSEMEENGDTLTFHPTHTVLYFGKYPIAGIEMGMTYKEVEQIIGPQDVLIFNEMNELSYPLSVVHKIDGFSISIGFDVDFEVTQFLIRIDEGEEIPISEPLPNEVESAFSEEGFNIAGLEKFTDFASGFKACYFNASVVTSSGNAPIEIGFYRYDLSKQEPTLISDQPMKTVFEILYDINPSIIAMGKEDGTLYKIDLNTFEANPVTGPFYKDYVAHGGMVIKASLLSD